MILVLKEVEVVGHNRVWTGIKYEHRTASCTVHLVYKLTPILGVKTLNKESQDKQESEKKHIFDTQKDYYFPFFSGELLDKFTSSGL